MGSQDEEIARKHKINEMESRKKSISETNEGTREESGMEFSGSEGWMDCSGSEEMKLGISGILEKVERFNQLVFEMLESGKAVFNKLNEEFEERVLMIHREKIEKWEEEIKELRMIDTSNEEMNACVDNVKCLLQTF